MVWVEEENKKLEDTFKIIGRKQKLSDERNTEVRINN